MAMFDNYAYPTYLPRAAPPPPLAGVGVSGVERQGFRVVHKMIGGGCYLL